MANRKSLLAYWLNSTNKLSTTPRHDARCIKCNLKCWNAAVTHKVLPHCTASHNSFPEASYEKKGEALWLMKEIITPQENVLVFMIQVFFIS